MFIPDKIIGHRGAAAYAPENTIASFEVAKDLGCKWIEFDVVLSYDGELFVFHDKTLERTTNGSGNLALASASYLKSLDAGKWFGRSFSGIKIPTFAETLIWLDQNNMHANIEIKPTLGFELQTTKAILQHLDKYWPKSKPKPLISSFNYTVLLLCEKYNPKFPLGLLVDAWTNDWLCLARRINCVSINLNKKIATKKRIQSILNHGFAVCIYTVNSRMQAEKFLNWGVGSIFSDSPDLLTKKDIFI